MLRNLYPFDQRQISLPKVSKIDFPELGAQFLAAIGMRKNVFLPIQRLAGFPASIKRSVLAGFTSYRIS